MTVRGRGLDVLIASVLAQNTNMANARRGFKQLRRGFRSWTQVMRAPVADVQRCIAVCGLARMRARRLQDMLAAIKRRHGKLCLQFVAGMNQDDAFNYLIGYFGVGPKTAAYTLLFAFNMPVFPVDKGIHRMARRLTLARDRAGEAETGQTIQTMLGSADKCYPLHVLMFNHAKAFCRPKNPKCQACTLRPLCPYGKRRVAHRPPEKMDRPRQMARFASAGLVKHGDGELETVIRRSA